MTTTYLATLADVGAGMATGTSFPVGPSNGDLFYRSDLDLIFRYRSTGTRWVTTTLYSTPIMATDGAWPISATGGVARAGTSHGVGTDLWLERLMTTFYVSGGGSALSGSHKWVGLFRKVDPAEGALVTVITVNIDSGASSSYRIDDQAIGALLGTAGSYPSFVSSWTKTGTPGNLRIVDHRLTYRIVAT